jgi:phospholipid/cholesterol/gamma-HCH transport system substrate-binding protein
MARKKEEIKVGIVVLVAVILFIIALVFVGGANLFGRKYVDYTTYFRFAGGLQPGSFVRYGGLKVGTVESASIDQQDTTRIRVTLSVRQGTPIRTNSVARISTLGFLGENYVEVSAGTRDARRLPPGSTIPSQEVVQLADVFNNVNNVTVNANKLVNDLDDRVLVLSDNANQLIKNFNDLVGPENRQHFSSVLANTDAMLAEVRPRVNKTLANLEQTSAKLPPTIDKVNVTIGKADRLTDHLDAVVQDNRQQIHDVLLELHTSLADAQRLVQNLNGTLDSNRGNLDETLENIRVTSENLRQFSDEIKQHPFSLVRIKTRKDREPPVGK